jgi:SPP1 family phage portal protein
MMIHSQNRVEIKHLFDYRNGKQPILEKVRPHDSEKVDINNIVVNNHAYEIAAFKVAYLLSCPIMYVNDGDEKYAADIDKLNDFMRLQMKETRDQERADDCAVCGVGYIYIEPNKRYKKGDSPFLLHTLSPDNVFVIRSTAPGEPIIAAVRYVQLFSGVQASPPATLFDGVIYSVYTEDKYFEINNGALVKEEENTLGRIPIIEYPYNKSRLGCFEVVESQLDAINTLESTRVDAAEQTVNAITIFENIELEDEDWDKLKKRGALSVASADGLDTKVYTVSPELNQADQQVLLDSLYNQVLRIACMPQLGDGMTSDSSNNGAVIVRNGWQNAEADAKMTESYWRKPETDLLEIALIICKAKMGMEVPVYAVKPTFTRHNYEDIMTKTTALVALHNDPYCHPQDAWEIANAAYDPQGAYMRGMEWHKENTASKTEEPKNKEDIIIEQ